MQMHTRFTVTVKDKKNCSKNRLSLAELLNHAVVKLCYEAGAPTIKKLPDKKI